MKRHPHRGVVIAGHPTSLRLEPEFWDFLREIAYERQLSLSELINAIRPEDECDLHCAIGRVAMSGTRAFSDC